MRFNKLLVVVIASGAGGCTARAPGPAFDSPIGVERLTVEESSSTLSVVGYAADGTPIAHIDLRTGTFYFDELEREVDGRQLRVEVRGHVVTHESAGQRPLRLPLFHGAEGAELNELLLDPRVRAPLASWQIEINDTRPNPLQAPVASPGNPGTPYGACGYAPNPGCAGNGAYSCVETPILRGISNQMCASGYEQLVCCASTANGGAQTAALRYCGFQLEQPGGQQLAGSAPRAGAVPLDSLYNPCGTEGPNGCAICWNVQWTNFCTTSTTGQATSGCVDRQGNQYAIPAETITINYM